MPEPAAPGAGNDAGAANAATIARFYAALGRRDAETMLACYAPDVRFSDPIFRDLDATGVAAMWRMLTSRGEDLHVVVSDITADAQIGRAHWVATYTFRTGRWVENRIDATFGFATAASSGTRIASASTAGRGRPSGRWARCSAGRRWCIGPCAGRPPARSPPGSEDSSERAASR